MKKANDLSALRRFGATAMLMALAGGACSHSDGDAQSTGSGVAENGATGSGGGSSATGAGGATSACLPAPLPLFTETVLPGEDADFAALGAKIQAVQQSFHDSRGAPITRGFHAKAHACVLAEFRVADNAFLRDGDPECKSRPAACPDDGQCSAGVFGTVKTYKAWVRFSNGLGYSQSDSASDVRGMAIKVMGVAGPKILAGEEAASTQDFLMTNAPTALTDTAQEFMEFAEATTGQTSLLGYLATHPTIALRLQERTSDPIGSMADTQFWSGSAYRLGRHAIKFMARPHSLSGTSVPSDPPDGYLRNDLVTKLGQGDITFDFLIQTQLDFEKEPIEQPTVEWKEADTPARQVATVVIPQQDLQSAAAARQEDFCNRLSFTPWHSLPEQRPLGNVNRGRKAVYLASRQLRGATPEPTGNEF